MKYFLHTQQIHSNNWTRTLHAYTITGKGHTVSNQYINNRYTVMPINFRYRTHCHIHTWKRNLICYAWSGPSSSSSITGRSSATIPSDSGRFRCVPDEVRNVAFSSAGSLHLVIHPLVTGTGFVHFHSVAAFLSVGMHSCMGGSAWFCP